MEGVESNLKDQWTQTNWEKETSDEVVINLDLVQLSVNSEEINRRIQAFIEKKREHSNALNIREFCHRAQSNDDKNSCARVDAILIKRKDSKSHVKVHRASNKWGPQTVDQPILQKAVVNDTNPNVSCSPMLDERISVAERALGIKTVPNDIYERIKNIEDRILHLESTSPEYKEFLVTNDTNNVKDSSRSNHKKIYSMAEIQSKLNELENKYAKKYQCDYNV